ncbi:MAG: pirin family protein [Betaproteobacteria bacterium]
MLSVRKADARGHANHGWLDSFHTFSFASYYEPDEMGFGTLRVINEDRVAPGMGFGTHPHRDMEIISYVLEGALEHRDSMGTGSVIKPGDVQRMSAGTGVTHSEYNHSPADLVHFLQIWIEPKQRGIAPSYEQKNFPLEAKAGKLKLVASPDGRDGSVTINQDAWMYAGVLGANDAVTQVLDPSHRAYLHVARGEVEANGRKLGPGDGLKITAETEINLTNANNAEVIVFDMA